MIIRRLEFCGIGPFGGEHVIDFDQLTESGIFLLDGPTGSGKSSIIDAIVFALYGSVAGKESSEERIRSTHTPPHEESWVDLVFSVASGTYRVRRTPQWERPKKSGAGTTKVNQSATLWKLSESAVDEQAWDAGEPISTQAREVGIELRAILGLDKKQFAQTVVLPQGQFADFLRLKSSERAPLLETIFDTGSYRLFAETLAKEASNYEKQLREAVQSYRNALNTWLEISDLPEQVRQQLQVHQEAALEFDVPSDPQCDADLLGFVSDTVADFVDQAAQQAKAAQIAQQAEEEARTVYENSAKILDAIAEHKIACEQYEELKIHRNERDAKQSALDAHHEAQLLAVQLDHAAAARQNFESCYEQACSILNPEHLALLETPHTAFTSALGTLESGVNIPDFDCQELTSLLEDQRTHLSETIGSLQSFAEAESRIEQREIDLQNKRAELDESTASIEELTQVCQQQPAVIDELTAKLAQAQKLQATLDTLESQRDAIAHQLELFERKTKLAQHRESAQSKVRDRLNIHREAKKRFDVLTEQWIASTAANLAEQLDDGAPCPVCGSCEHPNIATPNAQHTTREQVDLAHEALEQATASLDAANTELTQLQTQLAALDAELNIPLAELTQNQHEIDEEYARAEQAVKDARSLATAIEAQQQKSAQLAQDLATAQLKRAELQTLCELEDAALTEERARVHAARSGFSSVHERVNDLDAKYTQTHKQLGCLESLINAAATLRANLLKANASIAASSFATAEAVTQAVLAEDFASELRKNIKEFDDSLSAVKAKLAEPRFANLPDESSIDLAAHESQLLKAKEDRAQADIRSAHTQRFASDTQRLARPLRTASETWHTLAIQAGPLLRLADIAQAGRSSKTRVPLSMWVLLNRFEMVVDRANEHLARISGGRYELRRSNEGNRIQKTGLGLSIIDRDGSPHGDVERSTASLSGGETFYTSLSLALALAEVVQEENGGIRIDTLIIDEGFGTLSDDVRDTVMKTLGTLTSHGRRVGIVSHVEELKQMIPNRISITPAPQGGSSLTVIA
ncbi:exonuclease SbcC [Arcanobacterium pluranimalium]|uniref:AAA family ATPase n=1 Tax=Arcanobacterium pluranimalium TaxID=108028 RepID=UPI00195D70F8|nr:exonuclease SbcC [Arcanobacterium pluranimalium]